MLLYTRVAYYFPPKAGTQRNKIYNFDAITKPSLLIVPTIPLMMYSQKAFCYFGKNYV